MANLARMIAEAYRWQRRLGHQLITEPGCHIVADPAHPNVWDANHADEVTAQTVSEIDGVFAAMDRNLGHTPWRVIHTDGFTPDAFLARLALDEFSERPVTIQMVLEGQITDRGAEVDLRPVVGDADWQTLLQLVLQDHAEGRRSGGLEVSPEISAGLVAGYRAKSDVNHFHLVMQGGVPVAYGAYAAAPNGAGMIEDLFTLPAVRRQGLATGLIAAFVERLRDAGCHTTFLGALSTEQPKHLYARLGFRPLSLSRAWIRKMPQKEGTPS